MRNLICIAGVLALLASCGRGTSERAAVTGDTLTRHSRLLTLVEADGYIVADLHNPTDSTLPSRRIIMVPHDSPVPTGSMSENAAVIRVPATSSVVYSSVYVAAIDEIGKSGAVTGVADAAYIATPSVAAGLKSGTVADVGQSTQPSLEKIIALQPDLILASPMTPSPNGCEANSIEMADYLEATPLGRAEWIKLLGILYGNREKADSIFAAEETAYGRVKAMASSAPERPAVITEQLTSGVWYVPGGRSYMARMLQDAGGVYPWADDTSTGSLPLDMASVIERASDADIWLVKSYGPGMTLARIASDNPLSREIRAFTHNGVWTADTREVPLFEEFPFHPSRLLADMAHIFHPSLRDRIPRCRYYAPAQP